MSAAANVKLSQSIKQLISLPKARGASIPSPGAGPLNELFGKVVKRGEKGGVGKETWLTLLTAGVMTVNSPQSLCGLYDFASATNSGTEDGSMTAAIMREAGLKCISFNGIPRTINGLGALRAHLPEEVTSKLDTQAHREYNPQNIEQSLSRGRALWDDIYQPHHVKLLDKLSDSHPDLPVHILTSHYSNLLSDPFTSSPSGGKKLGRILTSLIAITCLRAQQGVGPQVTSHVFGLKKALVEGGMGHLEQGVEGQEWLASDQGVEWILESTDEITEVVAGGRTSFAGGPNRESKL